MRNFDQRLQKLAQRENNVVARAELHAIGMTDEMIHTLTTRLRWQQLQRGVYLMAAAEPTWRQLCRAALKAGGEATMLAGETGLAAYGVDGVAESRIHVQVVRPAQPRIRDVVLHRTTVPDKPRRTSDGLRTSSIERLLIDFAASAATPRVEVAVESALVRGLTSERRLWAAVAQMSHRMPGVAHLGRILELRPYGKAARSKLEIEVFKVLRGSGLALPVRNHDVWVDGKHYEIDCAYVEAMRAIECDSRRWHGTDSQRDRDRTRQSALEAQGWGFLRVGWADVIGRPAWVVEQVRALLAVPVVRAQHAQPHHRAG